jgi:hypothetical protein
MHPELCHVQFARPSEVRAKRELRLSPRYIIDLDKGVYLNAEGPQANKAAGSFSTLAASFVEDGEVGTILTRGVLKQPLIWLGTIPESEWAATKIATGVMTGVPA